MTVAVMRQLDAAASWAAGRDGEAGSLTAVLPMK